MKNILRAIDISTEYTYDFTTKLWNARNFHKEQIEDDGQDVTYGKSMANAKEIINFKMPQEGGRGQAI